MFGVSRRQSRPVAEPNFPNPSPTTGTKNPYQLLYLAAKIEIVASRLLFRIDATKSWRAGANQDQTNPKSSRVPVNRPYANIPRTGGLGNRASNLNPLRSYELIQTMMVRNLVSDNGWPFRTKNRKFSRRKFRLAALGFGLAGTRWRPVAWGKTGDWRPAADFAPTRFGQPSAHSNPTEIKLPVAPTFISLLLAARRLPVRISIRSGQSEFAFQKAPKIVK